MLSGLGSTLWPNILKINCPILQGGKTSCGVTQGYILEPLLLISFELCQWYVSSN